MSELIVISITIFLIGTIILTSRVFYLHQIKSTTNKTLHALDIPISSLIFTLEKLVLFESLKSYDPIINQVKKEQINVQYDYDSLLFQDIKGIKISIKAGEKSIYLAYLPIEDFKLPLLDLLKYQGKINDKVHRIITINQLLQPQTIHEIQTDIYTQIRYSTPSF